MYYNVTARKQDGTEIDCWIKQTSDTSISSRTSKGEVVPSDDFIIRGTDELNVGEYITCDISELEDYWFFYEGMPTEIPLLIITHSAFWYDLYGCVALLPEYKQKIDDLLEDE